MKGELLWDRFHDKFIPEPNSGCWLWIGSISGRDERGYIYYDKHLKVICAHRCSWMIFKGPIPTDLDVLHTCDVPSCVNPDHLFLGTHTDNMRDCVAKGRNVFPNRRGEECSWSKFTDAQISEIKTRELTTRQYADKFSVNIEYINQIQRGNVWAHVIPPFVVEHQRRLQTPCQAKRAAYMREYLRKRYTLQGLPIP